MENSLLAFLMKFDKTPCTCTRYTCTTNKCACTSNTCKYTYMMYYSYNQKGITMHSYLHQKTLP